jgi:hypothetical protein
VIDPTFGCAHHRVRVLCAPPPLACLPGKSGWTRSGDRRSRSGSALVVSATNQCCCRPGRLSHRIGLPYGDGVKALARIAPERAPDITTTSVARLRQNGARGTRALDVSVSDKVPGRWRTALSGIPYARRPLCTKSITPDSSTRAAGSSREHPGEWHQRGSGPTPRWRPLKSDPSR